MAHPDDELIWGWPILQNPAYEKQVLHCVSDENNPLRTDIAHRKDVAAALCRELAIPYENLGFDSDFYLTPQYRHRRRRNRLQKIFPFLLPPRPAQFAYHVAETLMNAISRLECDYIFTHNFWGEYGHMDHILVNSVVFNNSARPIIISGARIDTGWLPLAPSSTMQAALASNHLAECSLDRDFYERCAAHYVSSGTWTWNRPPMETADLFLFPGAREQGQKAP